MRILFLATNPEVEASTRYRLLQIFPALKAAGHQPDLVTFFDDWASSARTRNLASLRRVLGGFGRRLGSLLALDRYDLVVVHRELLPHNLSHPIGLFSRRKPVVYDFDDALWLAPSRRTWLPTAATSTRRVVASATRVLAGNEYLAQFARQSHPRVDVVPTVVDTDSYRPATRPPRGVPVIGWIGSPTTAPYLAELTPVLRELARKFSFKLRFIGGQPANAQDLPAEHPPWRLETEADDFRDLDIGLYPLTDDAWSQGKCGFKAIQYLASGVAAVVSPVGVVKDIAPEGTHALWARTPQEWMTALTRLLQDVNLRQRLAHEGRQHIEARFSLRAWAPRFVHTLEQTQRETGR